MTQVLAWVHWPIPVPAFLGSGAASATMELPGGMWRDEVWRELRAQGALSRLELFLKMALMDLGAAGGDTCGGTNGFRHNWR